MQQAKVLMLHLVMDRLQAIWLDHHQREIWDQGQMARLRVIWDQDQTDQHLDLMENQWDHLWVNHQIQRVVLDPDLMDLHQEIHYLDQTDQLADHLRVIQEDLLQVIL